MPTTPSLRRLFALAAPMIIARATQAVIGFADTLQVSHLGSDAVVATATGGLNTFGIVVLPMGTVFIVQSFVAQLTGRGARDDTPRYAWYGLALALLAGVVAAALIPFVGDALGLLSFSPAARTQMTTYLEIRLYAVAAIVGTEALGNWFGGLGTTWPAMVAGIIAMATNVGLNAILIDGRLGAPALGVAGTALASSIASTLGFVFLLVMFLLRKGGAPRGTRGQLSWGELRRVLRFGLPSGLNWFLEFAAFQLFVNIVLSGLGTPTLAAFNVVISVNMVSFMPAFGLASAGAILVGQAIGRGDRDAVWPEVRLTLFSAMAWMGLIGAIYALVPGPLLGAFAPPGGAPEMLKVGAVMLVMSAIWQLFDATSLTLGEALRAAGDTTWCATARLVLAWTLFVPAGLIAVRVLDGGAVGAMLCFIAYLALLALALAYRFRSGKWRTIELIEPTLV